MKKAVSYYILLILFSVSLTVSADLGNTEKLNQPNIILMIGDGMGVAHTTAYRYYISGASDGVIKETVFDSLFTGMSKTYPLDNTVVTDSAAGATALATGIKTYNGAISVDMDRKPLTTVLEAARLNGWKTGVVSTVQVTHATPASFISHNESRLNYNAIADSYLDDLINNQPKFDLLLGGGREHFIRKDRNLVNELRELSFSYIDDLNQLDTLKSLPVLGLFSPLEMPYVIDDIDNQDERLARMTETSLSLLSQSETPFFLMIEGGKIDWCSHQKDIACAMHEMNDFAKAVEQAALFVEQNPQTLLVITADHTTGGLSVGGWDNKKWLRANINHIHTSIQRFTDLLFVQKLSKDSLHTFWQRYFDFNLTEMQLSKLYKARQTGARGIVEQQLRTLLNQYTNTGWTSLNHSADDVQIFATGRGHEHFYGLLENTEIGNMLLKRVKRCNRIECI
jgi:alkaline phosphatase